MDSRDWVAAVPTYKIFPMLNIDIGRLITYRRN